MSEIISSGCAGGAGHRCHATRMPIELYEHEGHKFCIAHLPLGHPFKDPETLRAFVADAVGRGQRDFSGSHFPGGALTQLGEFRLERSGLVLRDCTFGAFLDLQLQQVDLSGSRFLGYVNLRANINEIDCSHCTFAGPAQFASSGGSGRMIFAGAAFSDQAIFASMDGSKVLRFDGAVFARAPTFQLKRLPQRTTFVNTQFLRNACGPDDEATYRQIRNWFHENRAREWEGYFYALEKRCHRRSLPWKSAPIARVLSWLYDVAARYGQSYERALVSLLAVQVGFGVVYSIASRRWQFGGGVDGAVVVFTLSQIAKPFELLSGRPPEGGVYLALLPEGGNAWWAVATFVHSVLSITLIALFILAIRWRFRRE